MKLQCDMEELLEKTLTLMGILTASTCLYLGVKSIKKNLKEKRDKENIKNLIQNTRNLKGNLNNEEVREYIKFISKIDFPNHVAAYVTVKDGYNIIKENENISEELKKDLKLLIEMKGVKDYLRY